jgi:hypothetical protein
MTDTEHDRLRSALQAMHAAMTLALARSIIDWEALEELLATSSAPQDFQALVDVIVRELQSHKDFPFRCANDQAV